MQILAASIAVFQVGTRGVLKRESALYQKLFAGCEESISQVRTVVAFAGEEKEFSMLELAMNFMLHLFILLHFDCSFETRLKEAFKLTVFRGILQGRCVIDD